MQILEAFRALNALNEDMFSLDADGIKGLSDFKNNDDFEDDISIIDPEAETTEDLQDNYIGKVILDCCVCHSKLYKAREEVTIDETGEFANVGEECPYCFTPDGFKVIGEVVAFEDKTTHEESEDEESKDVKEETEENETVEESLNEGIFGIKTKKEKEAEAKKRAEAEKEKERKRRSEEESERLRQELAADSWKSWDNSKRQAKMDYERSRANSIRGDKPSNTGYRGVSYSGGDYYSENLDEGIFDKFKKKPDYWSKEEIAKRKKAMDDEFEEQQKKEAEAERRRGAEIAADWAKKDKMQREVDAEYNRKRYNSIKGDTPSNTGHRGINYSGGDYYSENLDGGVFGKKPESLEESIEDLSMTANDTHVEIGEDESGKVTVTMEPVTADDGEMIAPVSDETETELLGADEEIPTEDGESVASEVASAEDATTEDGVDVDVDEVDEESMDELGESYFKRVYENVNSFKTTSVRQQDNSLIVEGKIKFNNGKVRKTSFMFEALDATKGGRVRFVGDNKNLTEGKKAFMLTGKMRGNKLIAESLNYNYKHKDADGKVSRVYGTERTSRR